MPDDQKCTEADFQKWADALAMTESVCHPEAWGDHNSRHVALACGRWQMHPVFVDRWWPEDFETHDSTTWDELFEVCLRNFFEQMAPLAPDGVALAMWFHMAGGKTDRWDEPYAKRFRLYYKPEVDR